MLICKYYSIHIRYFCKDLEEENCTVLWASTFSEDSNFPNHTGQGWKNNFLQIFCSQVFAIMVNEVKVLIKGSAGKWHVQNYNRKVAVIQPLGHLLWQLSNAGDRAVVEGKRESSQLCSIAFSYFSISIPYIILLFTIVACIFVSLTIKF